MTPRVRPTFLKPVKPKLEPNNQNGHNNDNNNGKCPSDSLVRVNGQKSKVRPKSVGGAGAGGAAERLGDADVEDRESKRARKREKKRQKELHKAEVKRLRNIARLEKHFTQKLGLKPSNTEAVLAAASTDPRYQPRANLIDLSILPTGDNIPLTKPLPYPFDCISFDGRYILSVLVMTNRRDCPTICRFVRVPKEDVEVLLGPMGVERSP